MKVTGFKVLIVLLIFSFVLSGCNLLASLANGDRESNEERPGILATGAPTNPPLLDPPTEPPTPTRTPHINITLLPSQNPVAAGTQFTTDLQIEITNFTFTAYFFNVYFDQNIITVDEDKVIPGVVMAQGVEIVSNNITSTANTPGTGKLQIRSNEIIPSGTGYDVYILRIHWNAVTAGTSAITLDVQNITTTELLEPTYLTITSAAITVN